MKRNIIRMSALLLSVLASGSVFAKETISVVGSSSVTPLMEVFSENYSKAHPNIVLEVQGPGTSAGIKAASNGSAEFGMASRRLTSAEEVPGLKEEVIAHDGIAVVVNAKNTTKNLTIEQVAKIYKGEFNNWKQVGGEDKPIVVITRDTASGTRGAFEDIMSLKQTISGIEVSAISQRAQVANGNGALKTMVASNPYAIGYISLGTVDSSVNALSINGVKPSVADIKNGTYKLSRPFIVLYREGKVTAEANKFLTWMLSKDAQQIVTKEKYISID